jgi:hypothetical protein
METYVLDKWDTRLIRAAKFWTDEDKLLDAMKEIWGERCAVSVEKVHSKIIVFHLLQVFQGLHLATLSDYAEWVGPESPYAEMEGEDYWDIVLVVLGSRLSATEVSKLPGFVVGV